jgi:hypothetical protein
VEAGGPEHRAAEAFGAEPPSFWQRWFRGSDSAAPRPVARTITFVSGLIVLAVGTHGFAAAVGVALVLGVPGALVERIYRARRRREQEQLLPPL